MSVLAREAITQPAVKPLVLSVPIIYCEHLSTSQGVSWIVPMTPRPSGRVSMSRPVLPVVIGMALVLGVIGLASTSSSAQSPAATPPAFALPECENQDWKNADVRPPGPRESQIVPAAAATPGADAHELYLVEIRLQPGECMPYEARGNQKDGAVIWMVQQGIV